jgi:hypothetical protein
MAMTSLATVEALQWLVGASTRLTAAATCAAKRGPVNRVHSAHSSTLKGAWIPSRRFSPRLGWTRRFVNGLRVIREEISCFLKNLHPACRVKSWVEAQKRKDESAHEKVLFGDRLPSVEQSMAEMPNIHMCLTSRIFEQAGCRRNRVLCGHFRTFSIYDFPASAKKYRSSKTVILMH